MGAGIDAQAQAHYNRVIADGGLIPSGLVGVNNFFTTVKAIYGTSDITTAISVGLDAQVLGYKLGAGAGTTAGQAAQKLYSCSGSSGDVEQTTASSQPLLLVHSGENYWFGSGVNGNGCYSNNRTFPTSNGGTWIIKFSTNNNNQTGSLYAHDDGGSNRNWLIQIQPSRFVRFLFGGSSFSKTADSTAAMAVDFNGYLKVFASNSGADMSVIFSTSTDGITYTQLGTTVTVAGGANSIGTGASPIEVSGNTVAIANACAAKVYRALAYDANNNLVYDFNPSQYNAANSQTQWVSTSGETWTINTGTAATGYKGALVSKTIVQGDGIDDRLTSNVIRTNILTQYLAANPFTNDNSGNSVLIDANNGAWLNSIVAFSSNIGNIMNSFASDLLRSRTPNRLILATSLNNEGVRNSISVNNGAETLNTYSPCPSGNGLNIFSRSGGGTFGNAIINTYISTIGQNNSTIRTAMYDYIRSINGSAF
jgi:hypothetical protein